MKVKRKASLDELNFRLATANERINALEEMIHNISPPTKKNKMRESVKVKLKSLI